MAAGPGVAGAALLILVGAALVGNTIVGGLPDKIINTAGSTPTAGTPSSSTSTTSSAQGLGAPPLTGIHPTIPPQIQAGIQGETAGG